MRGKLISTKSCVVLGLTGLVVSLVMMGSYIGLVPDRFGAIRDGRRRRAVLVH